MTPIDFDEIEPALRITAPLRHVATIPVLGIPVRFGSNAAGVIEIADQAFGAWRALDSVPSMIADGGVDIRLVVEAGAEAAADHAPIRYRMPDDDRTIITTAGSTALTDPARARADAWVTDTLVADAAHFRYGVLEALTLALLTHSDRMPLHAAALVREGRAVLLAGASGVGKSTLAWTAARAGWPILAEDVVYVQTRPALRVWGLPGHLHLPPDVAMRYPELHSTPAVRLANGKTKVAIDAAALGALPALPLSDDVIVCVLTRAGGGPALERLPAAEAARLLESDESGFDVFSDRIRPALTGLTRGGGWRLNLGDDPVAALPLIERVLDHAPGWRA
jgi:hypothetical protein